MVRLHHFPPSPSGGTGRRTCLYAILYAMKVTDEMLREAVENSFSYMGVLRCLGKRQAGGAHAHYKRRILKAGIDASHFTGQGHSRGKVSSQRKAASLILVKRLDGRRQNTNQLVRALIDVGVPHQCYRCGQSPVWMGERLALEVNHKDSNWLDDREENLQFLCPNCHALETAHKAYLKSKKLKVLENEKARKKNEYSRWLVSQQPKVHKLLASAIDFSKFGWVSETAVLLGIPVQKVNGWIRKTMPDFYEAKCFKRKAKVA